MRVHEDNSGVGPFDRLRNGGFYSYFTCVAVLVFVLLSLFSLILPIIYGQTPLGLNWDLAWEVGVNVTASLVTAGIAWKYNGKPWINRPDTIKLDLDK